MTDKEIIEHMEAMFSKAMDRVKAMTTDVKNEMSIMNQNTRTELRQCIDESKADILKAVKAERAPAPSAPMPAQQSIFGQQLPSPWLDDAVLARLLNIKG